ncbi:MAG TPA: hypothetical protein ENI49_04425 [Thermoplasmatales archaeon]|nr:hypothetical protein [Thermoplasmatales archaeon]
MKNGSSKKTPDEDIWKEFRNYKERCIEVVSAIVEFHTGEKPSRQIIENHLNHILEELIQIRQEEENKGNLISSFLFSRFLLKSIYLIGNYGYRAMEGI